MRHLKNVIAAALFSSVLLAGSASAQACSLPCYRVYQACIAAGGDSWQCYDDYDVCRLANCGNP
ncbi:hypothetical protein ABB28_07545 [Stenotrophomonas chelatiphaga]|uniref:Lipoprotein n=1 Tax=Stenotrophomonas chelatiphaga TaxID=517011 RepID=A0A0R0D979_9GAMM|nr:hypothetical protein [Stenotrophomonas chelatiphaga]KRG74337.1 hypothetical protein ABB28_07545 [Stenotrophomonas chelatiphaga]